MPKVKINNAQGLVQETGGGIALFSALETLVAAGGGGTQIAETTSLALCSSAADAHIIKLPAIGNLETGHQVVIVNTSTNKEFHIVTAANGTRMNGVANTPVNLPDVKEGSAVTCIYSGAANPGWIVLDGDRVVIPS